MKRIIAGKPNIANDLLAGIIVALVSIPISMGYAQIAGLPVQYGLYGSLLPILVFAFMTTSPMFVIGVDAMPAAMVGGLLATLGIANGSKRAVALVPVITICVAVWFIVLYLLRAGRIVKYISTPVMGGFISGVATSIILMQIPKLWGGNAGTGEIVPLAKNMYHQWSEFNSLSLILSVGTIVIILVMRKLVPKVPMHVVMMIVGIVLQVFLHLDQKGVKLLPQVKSGLPALVFPDIRLIGDNALEILIQSLSIAAVIMTQTLLATGNYAKKGNYEINSGREILSYSAMNVAGALVGCCPINGSVSRSALAYTFKAKSQLMSIVASVVMAGILLFGTPILSLLPIPVLTGIVITALLSVVEFSLAARLHKTSKYELIIFVMSFGAVLIFGTVYGVMIGCVISFAAVAVRAVAPSTTFLGRIKGQGNFYPLDRNSLARPIKNTIIYRFNGNIFFANIDRFQKDINEAIKPDTKQVVIDARSINSMDITAIDAIKAFRKSLQDRGIKFYITEHDGKLNDLIRNLGGEDLIEEGVMRRTITLALRDAGLKKPYELEDGDYLDEPEEVLAEIEWAFGKDAEKRFELMAQKSAEALLDSLGSDTAANELFDMGGVVTEWGKIGRYDEDEFWDYLEIALEKLVKQGQMSKEDASNLEELIEKRRAQGEDRLKEINEKSIETLHKHRRMIRDQLKEELPEEYARVHNLRKQIKNQS